MHIIQWLVPL
ncbi:hypothetical protein YPPY99_3752, partial [Yersinia pestis PY-99]